MTWFVAVLPVVVQTHHRLWLALADAPRASNAKALRCCSVSSAPVLSLASLPESNRSPARIYDDR
jgi:hypothetical protein